MVMYSTITVLNQFHHWCITLAGFSLITYGCKKLRRYLCMMDSGVEVFYLCEICVCGLC